MEAATATGDALEVTLDGVEAMAVRDRLLYVLVRPAAASLAEMTSDPDPNTGDAKAAWDRLHDAACVVTSISWLPDIPEGHTDPIAVSLGRDLWHELLDTSLRKAAERLGDVYAGSRNPVEQLDKLHAGHGDLGLWLGIRDKCHAARLARVEAAIC